MQSKYGLEYRLVDDSNWREAFNIQQNEWPDCPDEAEFSKKVAGCREDDRDFLVYKDGEIIGITGVTADAEDRKQSTIWMSWFTVVPKERGNGYGEAILRDTIDYCRSLKRYDFFRIDTDYGETRPSTCLYKKVMDMGEPYTAEDTPERKLGYYIFSTALGEKPVEAWGNKPLGLFDYYQACKPEADFEKYGIETMGDLFGFCQKLEYGWIDRAGQRHRGVNNSNEYFLQSPAEVLESQIGICWDQTELMREFFRQKKVECKSYFLYYYLNDDNCPSHSILVYKNGEKYCWFEPMFFTTPFYYSGIHEFNSLNELLENFRVKFIRNGKMQGVLPEEYDASELSLYQYDKPKYGISAEDFYNHCRTGEELEVR